MDAGAIGAYVGRRSSMHPHVRLYQDVWWEWRGACADARAPLSRPRRRLVEGKGLPMAYALGSTEFMGLPLRVRRPTLIPREDTATWVTELLTLVRPERILEIGFGSGCISLGLARALGPATQVVAIDSSSAALRLARLNQRRLGIANVAFVGAGLETYADSRPYDLIVCNPPYIPHRRRATEVAPSTRRWESPAALHCAPAGADDGAALHRAVVDRMRSGQLRCARVALELDGTAAQCRAVRAHAHEYTATVLRDGSRRPRAILLSL